MSKNNKNKSTNEEKVEEMEETIGRGGEQERKAIEKRARVAHEAREAMREGADKASKAIFDRARAAHEAREAIEEGAEKVVEAMEKSLKDTRDRMDEGAAEQAGESIRHASAIRKDMKEGNESEKEKTQEEE